MIALSVIVISSGSRTAYVALVAMLMSLVFYSRYRKRAFIGAMLFVVVAAPLVPDVYWERFNTIITQVDTEGASIDTRHQIIDDAVEIWIENPFGVGVGGFPVVRTETFSRSQDTHNLYLEVGTNLGIQGLIVFLGLVVSIMRSFGRTRRRAEDLISRLGGAETDSSDMGPESQIRDLMWVRAVAVSCLGFMVTRLTLGMFGHDLYEIYWWFSAGTAIALERLVGEMEEQAGASSAGDNHEQGCKNDRRP